MIYITGDTHGGMDINKLATHFFPEGKKLTKDDYVIILGDFGFIWKNVPDNTEKYWMDWFKHKHWTTLFIDGNHCNFDRLNNYPVEKWHGGKVHHISDSVIHLMRGQVFEIDGISIFTFGGAQSYDKVYRHEGISWWAQEVPSFAETDEALTNLSNNKIDVILTHTCPHAFSNQLINNVDTDPTANILDNFSNIIEYKKWYFGHWHVNKQFDDKHMCLYNDVIPLKLF